jgi:hypothetical protein
MRVSSDSRNEGLRFSGAREDDGVVWVGGRESRDGLAESTDGRSDKGSDMSGVGVDVGESMVGMVGRSSVVFSGTVSPPP